MSSIIVAADTLRSLAFGSISGTYAAIGTAFGHPMRMVRIHNTCNTDMFISFDGTNNHDYLIAGESVTYSLTANKVDDGGWFFRASTIVYVKQASAPSSGSVYVTAFYGLGE